MSRDIKDKVCDGLEYLYGRADFWRQQRPMYARKSKKPGPKPIGIKDQPLENVLRILEDIDSGEVIHIVDCFVF